MRGLKWILCTLLAGIFLAGEVRGQETVKIGILHSLTGTMAISETSLRDVVLMAVEEINAKGGVMGKKIVPVVVDPASNWDLFAEKAKELILKEKVAAIEARQSEPSADDRRMAQLEAELAEIRQRVQTHRAQLNSDHFAIFRTPEN